MLMTRRRPLGAAPLLVLLVLAVASVHAGESTCICHVCDLVESVRLSMGGGAGGASMPCRHTRTYRSS